MRTKDLIIYWTLQNADRQQIDHITCKEVQKWK